MKDGADTKAKATCSPCKDNCQTSACTASGTSSTTKPGAVEPSKPLEHYLVTSEHTWHVQNWNKLKNIEANEPIYSQTWEAGGHVWRLKMYPGGFTRPTPAHARAAFVTSDATEASHLAAAAAVPPATKASPALAAAAAGSGGPAPNGTSAPGDPRCNASDTDTDSDEDWEMADAAAAEAAANATAGGAAAAAAAAAAANGGAAPDDSDQHPQQHSSPEDQPGSSKPCLPLNKYVALFVERVGAGNNPQGVVMGADGNEYVHAWPMLVMKDQGPPAPMWRSRKMDQKKGRDPRYQQAALFSTAPGSFQAQHGYRKFVRRETVKQVKESTHFCRMKSLLLNDALLIRAKLIVLCHTSMNCQGPFKVEYRRAEFEPLPLHTHNHMQQLLSGGPTENGKNVRLLVGQYTTEAELSAHAQVLGLASSVLAAQLRQQLLVQRASGASGVLQLHLPYSAAACEAMLRVVYLGGPLLVSDQQEQEGLCEELLALADAFNIPLLAALAERALAQRVVAANAVATLQLAQQHHAQELLRVVSDFIAVNADAVFEGGQVPQGLADSVELLAHVHRAMRCQTDLSSPAAQQVQALLQQYCSRESATLQGLPGSRHGGQPGPTSPANQADTHHSPDQPSSSTAMHSSAVAHAWLPADQHSREWSLHALADAAAAAGINNNDNHIQRW